MSTTRVAFHVPPKSRSGLALLLLLGCYIALAVFVALSPNAWGAALKAGLLFFQYVIFLPGVIWAFLKDRLSTETATGALPVHFPALLVYAVAAISLGWFVNQAVYSGDESAYIFQARIFSAGQLTAEAPITKAIDHGASPEDFRIQHHIIIGDRWFGKYPPGWPAILAIGIALHAAWLVNPLLGLLILVITYKTAALVFDRDTARLAGMILVASPFFLLNCLDFMSHTACSVFIAGAVYFFFAYRYSARISHFAIMTVLIAAACMVRPYTAAFAGVLLCGTGFWTARREIARLLKLASISAAGGAASLAGLLIYNRLLVGRFWPVTYAVYQGSDTITELNFSTAKAFHNIRLLTGVAETILAAFPFVVVLGAYAVFRERGKRLETGVLAALFASLVFAYAGLAGRSFSFIGERYFFEAYFALAILAARAWRLLAENRNLSARAVRATFAALFLIQAIQYPAYIRIAANVREANRVVGEAAAHLDVKDAVVFLKSSNRFRGFDLNLNGPGWKKAPAFYIKDPGEARRDNVACALGRSRWMVVTFDDRNRVPVMQEPVLSRCEELSAISFQRSASSDQLADR